MGQPWIRSSASSINVVAIRRAEMVSVDIDPNAPLQRDDKLIVIANTEKLSKLK